LLISELEPEVTALENAGRKDQISALALNTPALLKWPTTLTKRN
jgi:hypothetical protein